MDIRDWKQQYGGYLAAVNSLKQDAALQTDAVKKKAFAKEQKPFKLRFAEIVRLYSGKV